MIRTYKKESSMKNTADYMIQGEDGMELQVETFQKKKYPTPRGKAANAAKTKYNKAHYDRVELKVPKGMKDVIKDIAARRQVSVNELIVTALTEKILKEDGLDLREIVLERTEK